MVPKSGFGEVERRMVHQMLKASTERAAPAQAALSPVESPFVRGHMGVQLPLPAGWARQLTSRPDPRDRLDALEHAKLTAHTEIRKVLTGLIDAFGIQPARSITQWITSTTPSAISCGRSRTATGARLRMPSRHKGGRACRYVLAGR